MSSNMIGQVVRRPQMSLRGHRLVNFSTVPFRHFLRPNLHGQNMPCGRLLVLPLLTTHLLVVWLKLRATLSMCLPMTVKEA